MENSTTAIIFGSNGQDGYYLKQLLEQHGIRCICISRSGDAVHGDVGNRDFVEEQIKQHLPGYIFHFAARSSTHHSAMFENHHTICTGTLNILEAVKDHSPNSKVFISGSAMQFKNAGTPIDEQTPFDASSPYSVARIQSVYAARYYREKFGIAVYVGYFFNHDSPLRTEHHVNQKIVLAVKHIQSGSSEMLKLGNINVKKEFSFAGDVVKAVWILVNQSNIFEAVIGSGKAYSIKEWVEYCFAKTGMDWKNHVTAQEGFIHEYDTLVSKPDLMQSLGWKPTVEFHRLADMMMEL